MMDFIKETRVDGSPLPDGRLLVSALNYFKGSELELFLEPDPDRKTTRINDRFFSSKSVERFRFNGLTMADCLVLCILCQARYHKIKYVSISGNNFFAPKKKVPKQRYFRDNMFAWDVCSFYEINGGAGNGWGENWAQYQIIPVFPNRLHGVWSAMDELKFKDLNGFTFDTNSKKIDQIELDLEDGKYEKYDPFK